MKSMRKIIGAILVLSLVLAFGAGCGSKETSSANEDTETVAKTATEDASSESVSDTENGDYLSGKWTVLINVKDYGTITCELDADRAPATVTNFVKLAREGFYDGLTFHRIIAGFMIQGGSPGGDGIGGSDETIIGEFSENGIENDISHVRGVISMARSTDYNSASSQFFIVQEDSTFLDGSYAGFGHVTDGMEIVDKICEDTQVTDSNGTVAAEDQPVIESITVQE